MAKWMLTDPDVLILDEPTRGIDVGAKYEIYCIINDLVAAGKSVIIISSELPEVLGMSDRIYVMNEGKDGRRSRRKRSNTGNYHVIYHEIRKRSVNEMSQVKEALKEEYNGDCADHRC